MYLSLYFYYNYQFYRGFESETDTEEYEKIGQMSIDKKPTQQSICVGTIQPEYCDMATNMSIVLKRDIEMVTDVSIFLCMLCLLHISSRVLSAFYNVNKCVYYIHFRLTV